MDPARQVRQLPGLEYAVNDEAGAKSSPQTGKQQSLPFITCQACIAARSPTLYSVVLPSKCSFLSASASWRVWWTTPSR